jgi:hypothetical protein
MECASSTGLANLRASFDHRCSPIDQLSKQIPIYTLISYPFIPLTSYSEFQEDDNGIYIGLETNKIRVKVQQVQYLHPNFTFLHLRPNLEVMYSLGLKCFWSGHGYPSNILFSLGTI